MPQKEDDKKHDAPDHDRVGLCAANENQSGQRPSVQSERAIESESNTRNVLGETFCRLLHG